MIRLQDLTPNVYYRKSRDFQFIGRLFDVALNSVKTNADIINILPVSSIQQDQKLTELLLLTLGFKSKHKYNLIQEKALCSTFAYLLRNKGTKEAIETACTMLLAAEGISAKYEVIIDTKNCTITIKIPDSLSDTNLLKDVLDYILPAGMTCNIYATTIITGDVLTEINTNVTNIATNSAENNMLNIGKVVTSSGDKGASFIGDVADSAGLFMNAAVTQPTETTQEIINNEEEDL